MQHEDVWLVYEPDSTGERAYWQGKGSRIWRTGEVGRAGAARFPDMHAAREAIASSRTQRRRLPNIGYEGLPATVVQLEAFTI